MAILSKRTWKRHANPWSGWTRALSMPFLAVGLYMHSPWVLAVVVIWLIINPFVFPEPANVDNWMSKGVLGEQIYYRDGVKFKKDLPILLVILNIPASISFIYFSWLQEFAPMILAGILVMTVKFWFIDRMVFLAEGINLERHEIEGCQ